MAILVNPPCVVFEDDHLLVVNKPPGWNTHSPAPYAGEGIYEWLKNREPRWAKLAIIHRLDKETSGLLVFSKTTEANRSLTQQFTEGKVRKEYLLRSTGHPPARKLLVESVLKRAGDRYYSQPGAASGAEAKTEFEVIETKGNVHVVAARPLTGRTHQIRVHACENGFAILGDRLYGGALFARLCLHAQRLQFLHPITKKNVVFSHDHFFDFPPWLWLRQGQINSLETDAFRMIHGAADGFSRWSVDQFESLILSQSPQPMLPEQKELLATSLKSPGIYHKITTPHIRGAAPEEASPLHISGPDAKKSFTIVENSVRYEINFNEGYSPGIFLDQRDNRRRLLTGYVGPDFSLALKKSEILNSFAYTCAFSVCAALAGARVTSLDLSRKYLDWGRRNFQLNKLDHSQHDFIYGDVFDWLKRFGKKQRLFDVILLDPPTFSKSKESGLFRAEKDFARLVGNALKVLRPGGVLFASSNAAKWAPEDFVKQIHGAAAAARRKIVQEQYVPQPPDFPISKQEPAYLKTLWMRIA